ncbi:transposase [Singulisphaera acidiphila DSM 18658]|uniref:Transposase n=1 Tax=Singulisphaera acidiphila (strain ATCC BAA-1392 / DSM 18658 / VKM B-2454 / MOB10) TaxID=886293 RepID=L0DBE0_SINAD|nr:transposase [Singulisphaera acidiphila DSM 18658]
MPNGSSFSLIFACSLKMPASESTTSATSSTPCVGSSEAEHHGVTCPPTSLLGRWSISRPAAGLPPAVSRPLSTTFEPCSASLTREPEPTAVIFDGRTIQSTPESGGRAGYDGYKRRKGAKVHMAVDTLGHLLALHVTPANEQERAQVDTLAKAVQEATGESVELAYVDQGYTGEEAFDAAAHQGIILEVVKLDDAKRGFVLLPRRWVVERSFGWAARFRRLAKDYERLSETLAGLHYVAFSLLMLRKAVPLFEWSS